MIRNHLAATHRVRYFIKSEDVMYDANNSFIIIKTIVLFPIWMTRGVTPEYTFQ